MAEGCSTVRRMDSLPQYRTDNFRIVDKQEVGTWLSCRYRAPVRSRRIRVRCRGDHSRPLESAACSRDTVRLSARKRGPEGTEFAPIRRLRNGTALRTSGEDHVERAAQNRVSSRNVSPRARPPAPLLHHPNACLLDRRIETPSCRNPGRHDPQIHGDLDPAGHRYGPNVSAFAYQIDDCPMVLALLYMRELQVGQFAAPQTAAKQDGENCPVPLAFERVRVRGLPEFAGLPSGEPISKPDTKLPGPFHPPDAGGELRTEQASVGSLIGEPPHCSESSIDRSCRELAILEENAITGDHNLVERQAWFGAVPLNEFIDRVSISALRLGRAKAIQDRRFAVVQIREAELCFRPLWFRGFPLGVSAHSSRLHRGWPRAYACTQTRRAFYVQAAVPMRLPDAGRLPGVISPKPVSGQPRVGRP